MRVIPIDPVGVMAPTGRRECGVFAQLLACWDWHSCSGPNRPSQQSYRPRDRSVTCHRPRRPSEDEASTGGQGAAHG